MENGCGVELGAQGGVETGLCVHRTDREQAGDGVEVLLVLATILNVV